MLPKRHANRKPKMAASEGENGNEKDVRRETRDERDFETLDD